MFETRIQIESGQTLTLLEMASNVVLAGWAEADMQLRLHDGQQQDLKVEQTAAGPAVSARVGCEVRVPASLRVKVREVKGNMDVTGIASLDAEQVRGNLKLNRIEEAAIAEVYGNLRADSISSLRMVGTVFGDASLKAVGTADLQNVRGNLSAKAADSLRASRIGGNLQGREIAGPLDAGTVGGNALLRSISGAVAVEQVAGNLVAKHLAGGAKVPKIGGNLTLNGELGQGCTYQFHVRGNANLRLAEDVGADLTLRAGGHIVSSLPLADQIQDSTSLSGRLGQGGTEIALEAGGNVMLGGGRPSDAADLGEEISRQVEEGLRGIDLEAIGQQVSAEMESALSRLQVKLESVDWAQIGLDAQRGVERAMEQLQRNMDRMAEKAARQQRKMERRLEREQLRRERWEEKRQRAARRESGAGPAAEGEGEAWAEEEVYEPANGPAAAEPDLDEERLSILRMVEQGQITPEEAEMLLDALE